MCGGRTAARTPACTSRKVRRAGIEPYEPRNNREEGPEKGLFTGSEGELVIFRKPAEPETDSETEKRLDETADGEQQKADSKEKKATIKGGEQQP